MAIDPASSLAPNRAAWSSSSPFGKSVPQGTTATQADIRIDSLLLARPSAGRNSWTAVEVQSKSVGVVQPDEFFLPVMVDFDSAVPQTSSIQLIKHVSQESWLMNAERKVVQPGCSLSCGAMISLESLVVGSKTGL